MNRFSFWQKWLFIVSLVIVLFGAMMALFSGTKLFGVFDRQINPAFWNTENVDNSVRQFQKWIYGVTGASMAGWGLFMAFIVHYPFKKKERWSSNCFISGLLLWFVIDTAISLYFKVYFNAVFNISLTILAILPLAFTRKHFVQTPVAGRKSVI